MSQAEITSLATLISTLIAAIIIVLRIFQVGTKTDTANTKADDISGKADNISGKIDDTQSTITEVKSLVNGNLATLLKMINDLRTENSQLKDKSK